MKEFILDKSPNFGEAKVTLKDATGKKTNYVLRHDKQNVCVFSVEQAGIETDHVVFTPQELRALYLLICVPICVPPAKD